MLGHDRRYPHLIPMWQDVEALQSTHAVPSPLADFTDMPLVEERITASVINPLLMSYEIRS